MKKLLLLFFAVLFTAGFSQKTTKQLEVQKIFDSKKFYDENIYLKDLEGGVQNGVVDYTEAEIECLGYYIGRMKALGKLQELRKYKYEEIYWMSEAECQVRNSVAKEAVPEKVPELKKSHSEATQYFQVQFSKTKKGYDMLAAKMITGDQLSYDITPKLQDQIRQDFEKDKPGNYTAFYDISYIDEHPTKISLKTRLNR